MIPFFSCNETEKKTMDDDGPLIIAHLWNARAMLWFLSLLLLSAFVKWITEHSISAYNTHYTVHNSQFNWMCSYRMPKIAAHCCWYIELIELKHWCITTSPTFSSYRETNTLHNFLWNRISVVLIYLVDMILKGTKHTHTHTPNE